MFKFINNLFLKNLMILGLLIFISSCGNKGPLELPESSVINIYNFSTYTNSYYIEN